ncbi:MAG: type VI secretion system protein TssA [Mariniblastus sp.]
MPNQFDNLLSPLAGDSPCGDEHIYSRQLRETFSKLRKPEEPENDGDTSFRRTADWSSLVELSESALSEQTKDIRIVCHLIEAWTQIRGFAGLYDGLALLTEFVETCWERSNPPIEDGDLEVRTLPLENMLDDSDRGTCFPMTIRQIPILGNDSLNCDFLTHQELYQSSDEEDQKSLTQIIGSTDPTAFARLASDVDHSAEQLKLLKSALTEKLENQAPGLTYLRGAIEDCQRVVKNYLPKISPSEGSVLDPETNNSDGTPETSAANQVTDADNVIGPSDDIESPSANSDPRAHTEVERKLRTRSDAYRQLSEAAEFLQKTEPHSPIPYLVRRAVDLGQLQFPMLVQQLVREEGILGELRREFGIIEGTEESVD